MNTSIDKSNAAAQAVPKPEQPVMQSAPQKNQPLTI